MREPRPFRLALAALAACALLSSGCNLGCLMAPCDGSLQIGVMVKDPSGAAIAGVRVEALGYAGETDANGCAKIDGIVHPASIFRDLEIGLSAEQTGYKPLRGHRSFGVYRVDVTLQPTASSKPSSAVWTAVEPADLPCTTRP